MVTEFVGTRSKESIKGYAYRFKKKVEKHPEDADILDLLKGPVLTD